MQNRYSLLCIAVLLTSLSCQLFADTVLLKNGDKITGEIKSFNKTHLSIKPSYSPKIAIKRSAIHSLETTQQQHWSINRTLQNVRIQSSEQEGFVLVNHQQTPILELMSSDLTTDSDWHYNGSVETAIDVAQNNTRSQKFHAKGDITAETLQWRHNVKSEVRYEKEDDMAKRNTIEGHYSLDYLISEHWLLRQEDFFQQDNLGNNVSNYYAALGPGYRFWGLSRNKLDFVVTYNHFWLESQILSYQLNAWAGTLNYKQYWFGGNLETYADLQIAFPNIPTVEYISNSTLGLKYLLTEQMYVSFKYDINDTKSEKDIKKDTSYTLGLGVNF
ncbi:MAG: DUF481 domain-containing protein [Shewanella sp.]